MDERLTMPCICGSPLCAECGHDISRPPRVTFAKVKTRMGEPALYTIKVNGNDVGRIQQTGAAWFWYADGVNTIKTPATLASCKAQVKEHYKRAYLKAKKP
jgi:hypothetical protein